MIPNVKIVRWSGRKENKYGELPIAFQVVFNRKAIIKMSGFFATEKEWEPMKEEFTSKRNHYTLINRQLSERKSNIEKELLLASLKGKLTRDIVHNIVVGNKKSDDFYEFCETMIDHQANETYRYSEGTRKHYHSELTKLKGFRPELRCADIDVDFLKGYEGYCYKLGNQKNTVWKTQKFVRTMVKYAIAEGLIVDDPYKRYKLPRYTNPKKAYLDKDELERFKEVVLKGDLTNTERLCGLYFLRQCWSGLRISDNMAMNPANINKNWIILTMKKVKREVQIPIKNDLKKVFELIGNQRLFVTDQVYNRALKTLGALAGIDKPMSSHLGRHTFGFLLARSGVRPEIAKEVLGHAKLETTMLYYHLSDDTISKELDKLDVA